MFETGLDVAQKKIMTDALFLAGPNLKKARDAARRMPNNLDAKRVIEAVNSLERIIFSS